MQLWTYFSGECALRHSQNLSVAIFSTCQLQVVLCAFLAFEVRSADNEKPFRPLDDVSVVENVYTAGKGTLRTSYTSKEISKSWALAGCQGALTGFHADMSGLCTYVRVLTGKKVWYVRNVESTIEKSTPLCAMSDNDIAKDTDGTTSVWPILLLPGDEL